MHNETVPFASEDTAHFSQMCGNLCLLNQEDFGNKAL